MCDLISAWKKNGFKHRKWLQTFLVPCLKETLPGSLGDLSRETRGTEYTALVSFPKVLFINIALHSAQLEASLDGSTHSISMAKKSGGSWARAWSFISVPPWGSLRIGWYASSCTMSALLCCHSWLPLTCKLLPGRQQLLFPVPGQESSSSETPPD